MKNPSETNARNAVDALDLELLSELERQSMTEIRKLRAHERVDIRVQLTIQPGNSSQLGEFSVLAATCNVSAGGCLVQAPVPVAVGDVFRLQFDRSRMDVPLVFGRCVRCRLLREDAFEVAFSFFSPIELGTRNTGPGGDLLE